ncbi:ketopantoate reductase family protein [Thiothrix nivea]|uniref:2-dehydropantoate 2-reductase n=1 Tax=Thiothrix nivea (strain ATCC 35100 / DSM 5205 / JP2) TaxID=870187 RepID=A0A656HMX0_THINJ|nr:2-dehydropantoate 2-reductase [Thiothrix nivea]EIJ36700.1 ketopantoate reductase [Thiothrix nivea DSM 5205]
MMKQGKTWRIAVIGAGGIGCYYGARLLTQGHDVWFVARGAHLRALQATGLSLSHPDFNFNGKVEACSLNELLAQQQPADLDALLICTKATATQEVAALLHDWFTRTGQKVPVISLQNGIDNEPQLADMLGADCVIGGLAVRIGGHITCPGVVEATGVAQVIMGTWPHAGSVADQCFGELLPPLVEAFNQAGIPTRQVTDIRRELWRKLLINNGVNPLSALTGLDTRTLSNHPQFGSIVHQLMLEAASVARADDEPLTTQDADEMYELIRAFDPIKTSMLVDLEKGRQLEVDAISGAVIRRARQLGLAVPYTETVHALLKHQLEGT